MTEKRTITLCPRKSGFYFVQLCVFVANVLFCLNSCEKEPVLQKVKSTSFAMGTVVEITVFDTSDSAANKAIETAFNEISRIASLFYEGNPESPLYAFNNRKTAEMEMPVEVLNLIRRGLDISEKTGGAFDMTIGILLPLYKFRGDSLAPPALSVVNELLPFVDRCALELDFDKNILKSKLTETRLATGGIAKGYAVDRAIEILSDRRVAGALVNAGGDLRVIARKDGKPWRVGIQNPRKTDDFIHVIEITEGAVTTSGDYQKYFFYDDKRIHHILNPKTGLPADSCQSVTVIAPTAELADALATGLFVMGVSEGLKSIKQFPNCEALWVRADGNIFMSEGFERYLVTLN